MKLTLKPDPEKLVGQAGQAVCDLTPQGKVSVQGFEYEAHTAGVFYAAGTEIVVVDVDHLGLVVRVPSDSQALDALVNLQRPKLTPRRQWWARGEASSDNLPALLQVGLWIVFALMLLLMMTGLAAAVWFLF